MTGKPARTGSPSGCNPQILLMGIEAWFTERGYRIDTADHPNVGRASLAADLIRSYGLQPESAPIRQSVGNEPTE